MIAWNNVKLPVEVKPTKNIWGVPGFELVKKVGPQEFMSVARKKARHILYLRTIL